MGRAVDHRAMRKRRAHAVPRRLDSELGAGQVPSPTEHQQ